MREHAHRIDRLLPAPGVDHEQGVLAGAGAVHPVQPALGAEAGLVEPCHVAGGDLLPHQVQELIKLPGGAGGQRRDRAG